MKEDEFCDHSLPTMAIIIACNDRSPPRGVNRLFKVDCRSDDGSRKLETRSADPIFMEILSEPKRLFVD
jgi:hypothetical protein